jgi:hypothetical protein
MTVPLVVPAENDLPSDVRNEVCPWYHGSVLLLRTLVAMPSQSTSMSAFQK